MNKKSKKQLKENSFEAGTAGSSGVVNYSTGYGTPQGGNVTQNPNHFSSSDKTTDHFQPNTTSGSAVPTMPDRPDVKGNNNGLGANTDPDANADKLNSEKPLDPDKQYDGQVDQIFQKKQTPSPDEIMSALQYELSNMVKKDKTIAKQQVLKNLKTNPHYYSRLDMLNIDDKKMKVDEDNSTFSKTKAVLDEMVAARKKNVAVTNTPEITEIFKDLTDRRLARKGRL